VLAEADEPMYALDKKVDAALLIRKGVALFGTPDEVGEAILKVKEQCGYEDFMFHAWFETGGFRGRRSRPRCSTSPRRSHRSWLALAAAR
jgi:alkanesulfonate monooxygenase SsuD/methylene tetrahydromethanopterin reductase-like flavin-dependent oxidoreductase (luciferase family)